MSTVSIKLRNVRRLLCSVSVAGLVSGAAFASGTVPAIAPLSDRDFIHDGQPDEALVRLGRDLFFDPILSGNRNISCGTCHDPALGTGDGLALGIGEGGEGQGTARHTAEPVLARVPRNAQPLFNIGAREYDAMFHDGRLEPDPTHTFPSGFWSPAREHLPVGLDSLLAAQAMFPVLSAIEMAGHKGENSVANAVANDRPAEAWALLAARLQAIPGYAEQFSSAFAEIERPGDIRFVHAARALAAFQSVAFRSQGSLFDRVLETGDASHLSRAARRGMSLFYGEAGCVACHSGPLLTDHGFHAIAMPQTGPGKEHGSDTSYWRATGFAHRPEDEGRFRVTFDQADLFRFRTPSLRNVELTGPWGHSGAYATLEAVVRHHLDPVAALEHHDGADLPTLAGVVERAGRGSELVHRLVNPARRSAFDARDNWVQATPALRDRIADANELAPTHLDDRAVADLVVFLKALTDPAMRDRSHLVPDRVPSGLPPQPQTTNVN